MKRVCKVSRKHTAAEVPVPLAVKDYNHLNGGINHADQLICSYSSWRKSRKWFLTVLHHLVDIAVTNSYLLHKELCGRMGQQPMMYQAFQEEVTAELCGMLSQPVVQSFQHIVEGASGLKKPHGVQEVHTMWEMHLVCV